MTHPTFNLLDRPWIPCIGPDGRVEELGLEETLMRAHELQGVAGESPPVTAALYRLLLAVLYRALGPPRNSEVWEEVWRTGRWDMQRLQDYLERWRHRFDLFHPEYPFYQWRSANSTEKSVNPLVFHVATGHNPTLFNHYTDNEDLVLSPAEAIRVMLAVQAFSLAGTAGMAPKDSANAPWANSIIFLAEGHNLFQTLAFNWMPQGFLGSLPSGEEDRPIWEADDPATPRRDTPLGITDYLTWPNRAIRFIPELLNGQVQIRRAEMGSGLKLAAVLDPFKHYRKNRRTGYRPMQFSEGRALWRDSATLLELRTEDQGRSPQVFHWLAELLMDGVLDRSATYRYMALGMASGRIDTEPNASNAKIHFYREEHMPLPARYLQDETLVEWLKEAITVAENVCKELRDAATRLATLILPTADEPDERRSDRQDAKKLRQNANNLLAHWAVERIYWAELEPAFFELLEDLVRSPDAAVHQWLMVLHRTALRAFAQAEQAVPDNARGLRAAVRARGQLMGELKKVLPLHTQTEVTHVAD